MEDSSGFHSFSDDESFESFEETYYQGRVKVRVADEYTGLLVTDTEPPVEVVGFEGEQVFVASDMTLWSGESVRRYKAYSGGREIYLDEEITAFGDPPQVVYSQGVIDWEPVYMGPEIPEESPEVELATDSPWRNPQGEFSVDSPPKNPGAGLLEWDIYDSSTLNGIVGYISRLEGLSKNNIRIVCGEVSVTSGWLGSFQATARCPLDIYSNHQPPRFRLDPPLGFPLSISVTQNLHIHGFESPSWRLGSVWKEGFSGQSIAADALPEGWESRILREVNKQVDRRKLEVAHLAKKCAQHLRGNNFPLLTKLTDAETKQRLSFLLASFKEQEQDLFAAFPEFDWQGASRP